MKTISNSNQIEETWVTTKQACLFTGFDRKTFMKWGVKPVAKFGQKVYYIGKDVCDARAEYEVSLRVTTSDDEEFIDKDQEYAGKLRQERIKLELANAITMREQAPVQLLTFALENIATQIIPILEGIVLTIKREIPDIPMSALGVVDREIAKARNSISGIEINWNDLDE